jgi:hypothetical protein
MTKQESPAMAAGLSLVLTLRKRKRCLVEPVYFLSMRRMDAPRVRPLEENVEATSVTDGIPSLATHLSTS